MAGKGYRVRKWREAVAGNGGKLLLAGRKAGKFK
jgi:hypothetical protein